MLENPYQTFPTKIIKITEQAPNIKLFRFDLSQKLDFLPGQIIFLSIPGFGEAPFAPCNPPETDFLELCVRKVGKLTQVLHKLKVGDSVGIRGPYGNSWSTNYLPNKTKDLLIVVGGLGIVPLRTLLWGKDKFLPPKSKIQVFYGAKTPDDFLFKNDFSYWQKSKIDVWQTIDKECSGWNECVGVVTALFDKHMVSANTAAFLCGPPVMYKFVLEKLKEKNVPDENIYLSLERRMHCGIGVCQHCAVGSFYVCKDGPVFRYDKIKNIPGAI